MAAPLLGAAARGAAAANGRKEALQGEGNTSRIQRTPAQERARLSQARLVRQFNQGSVLQPMKPAANDDTVEDPANDNEKVALEEERLARAQERVNRLRYVRAQVLLAPQEEAEYQVEKEEKQKPNIIRYIPAGLVALFDDVIDFFVVGALPVIGTLISLLCSFLIFILLFFTKKNGGAFEMRLVLRRLLILFVAFIIEGFVLGVNFFPFQTGSVALIYLIDRHFSKKQIALLKNLSLGLGKKPL